ncbi:CRISP/Allergen/PR-1-like, partial [Sitophilus oryzae]|uniref:CRISP/Allergen/PR-1-like n=1 Tax=Sitophilus oryzae TaxID=7048 RepID=A0A6J2YVL1_SITOR
MSQIMWISIILMAVYFQLGSGAGTILGSGVSQSEQNAIVNIHNNFRQQIASGSVPGQPKGINLRRFSYDSKLAEEAQKISNTMVFQHVAVKDSRFYVGQNLYLTSSTAAGGPSDWNAAITGWFSEYKSYKYDKCCAGFEKTGHYTQVVWADTRYVGCGYTYYYEAGTQYPYKKFYTCNYGPGGNIAG